MEKPGREYFNQGTKFSIISNGTNWNCVLSDRMEEEVSITSVIFLPKLYNLHFFLTLSILLKKKKL